MQKICTLLMSIGDPEIFSLLVEKFSLSRGLYVTTWFQREWSEPFL
jgi:hypothetical protein